MRRNLPMYDIADVLVQIFIWAYRYMHYDKISFFSSNGNGTGTFAIVE